MLVSRRTVVAIDVCILFDGSNYLLKKHQSLNPFFKGVYHLDDKCTGTI